MYFDDFIAEQVMAAHHSARGRDRRAPQRAGLLRTMWNGVRQVAWGIDAYSTLRHGIDLPPDHGARRRHPRG